MPTPRPVEAPAAAAEHNLPWRQFFVQFSDWNAAEQIAAVHLAPILGHPTADADGQWWFMRKYPHWRLRLRTEPSSSDADPVPDVLLNDLMSQGHVDQWHAGIYEPETAAFGGPAAMDHAHTLFATDSSAILEMHKNPAALGRRELSVVLCSALMRAARLEWYEQGDVWDRVAHERPLPTGVPSDRLQQLAGDLRRLLRADSTPDGPLFGHDGTLAAVAPWAIAFAQAGEALGAASRAGTLERGLRDVLSYHVIFHWNRLGLPAQTQSILAWAAQAAVLEAPPLSKNTASPALRGAMRIAPLIRQIPARTPELFAISRFPLILQARRRGSDLVSRVAEVQHYAETCQHAANARTGSTVHARRGTSPPSSQQTAVCRAWPRICANDSSGSSGRRGPCPAG